MRTADVISVFQSAKALADFLGLSKSAISQWGDEVPALRVYELREKRPALDSEIAALVKARRRVKEARAA